MTLIRVLLPVIVGLLFIALAFTTPDRRVVWIVLGIVFLAIGVRRIGKARDTSGRPPGAS